jgi:hypothetical protein
MQPLLDEHSVRVVALSRDTVAQAANHRRRDGLSFTMLADPKLAAIEAMGLVHQAGLRFVSFTVLGVPLGYPAGFERMAIPTTLLLEDGVVRWIDQADDYRLRGDQERIRGALESSLGSAA